MSYGIHPYAVSVAEIKRAVGSKDAKLLKTLRKEYRRELKDDADDLDADEGEISLDLALEHLINGDELNEHFGYKYGYALKLLCEHFGDLLNNGKWSALGWDWIETVDEALSDAGVDAKVFRMDPHLTTRGAPIKLPDIDDFPSIGYVLESEIAKIIEALRPATPKAIDDEEISDSIEQVRTWLNTAAGSHRDLVCFYH